MPVLGPDFSTSLVRRGKNDLDAKPWIQIESPHPPATKSQERIRSFIHSLCAEKQHQPIPVHFITGRVNNLKSNEEDDLAGGNKESAEDQKVRFNYNRPTSRPGMGASLGLMCSDKVSATLGGYILIAGQKFMLTSDHFFKASKDQAKEEDLEHSDVVISPSRRDLKDMELCLKQTQRDLTIEKADYSDSSDRNASTAFQREMSAKELRNDSLIGQVTKEISEYIVGDVKRRKTEPRTASIPESLAAVLRRGAPKSLNGGVSKLAYYMDWALCALRNDSGENRHKYGSREDAMSVIDQEGSNSSRPGEICHTICDAEADVKVHYVGRSSLHRKGRVNLPMVFSTNGSVACGWAIIPEGRKVSPSELAGDSGAWVIRDEGHSLMGQIFATAQGGQILFTPAKVIFDELREMCNDEILLPPAPQIAGQRPLEATPLCAVEDSPQPRQYEFLMHDPVPSIESAASSSTLGSSSSPPALTDTSDSLSITTDFPASPGSDEVERSAQEREEQETYLSEEDQNVARDIEESEIPKLSLDKEADQDWLESNLRMTRPSSYLSTLRAAITWPVTEDNAEPTQANRSLTFPSSPFPSSKNVIAVNS